MASKKENNSAHKPNFALPSSREVNEHHQAMYNNIIPSEAFGNYRISKTDSGLIYQNKYEQIIYYSASRSLLVDPFITTIVNLDEKLVKKLKRYPISEVRKDFFSLVCFLEEPIIGQITSELMHKIFASTNENILIISPPNAGKTSNVIEYLLENNIPFILFVPLTLQVTEISKKYHQLFKVDSDTELKEIKDALFHKKSIITVYDKADTISSKLKYPIDYVCVVDEYHKLVTDSNYRGKAILGLKNIMYRFIRTIALTGSPYGCIDYRRERLKFKLVRIKPVKNNIESNGINLEKKFHIVKDCGFNNQIISNLFGLLEKFKSNELQVVFANNKETLKKIEKYLIIELGISEKDIVLFTSLTKQHSVQNEIVETGKIPENIRYLLSTSVLATGVNIKAKADKIYILSEPSVVEVYQFINRFRYGVGDVYDLINKSSEQESELKYYKFSEYQARDIDSWEYVAKYLTGLAQYREFPAEKIFGSKKDDEKSLGFLHIQNKNVEIFEELITYMSLRGFFNLSLRNEQVRKLFIAKYIGNQKIVINSISDLVQNGSLPKPVGRDKLKINFEEAARIINQFHDDVFNYLRKDGRYFKYAPYKQNKFVNQHFKKNTNFSNDFLPLNPDAQELSEYFNPYVWYLSVGLDNNLALKLIKHSNCSKLFNNLKYYYYARVYELNIDRVRKDDFEGVNRLEYNLVSKLHSYITDKGTISLTELKRLVRENSKNDFLKYFSKGMISRLDNIYDISTNHKKVNGRFKRNVYHFKKISTIDSLLDKFDVDLTGENLGMLNKAINLVA